jgi:hypothetical protein
VGGALWAQRPFRLLWPPICWAVLVFLLYALVRCRLVVVEYRGRGIDPGAGYGALFFVVLNNLNRKNSATSSACTDRAGIRAVLGVFQFATHYPHDLGSQRRTNSWGAAAAPLSTQPPGRFPGDDRAAGAGLHVMSRFSATIKVLLAYSAVTMLAGIGVSLSRGGILAIDRGPGSFLRGAARPAGFLEASAGPCLCILTALAGVAVSQFDSVQKRFDEAFKMTRSGMNALLLGGRLETSPRSRVWGIGPGHFRRRISVGAALGVQSRPTNSPTMTISTCLCEWGVPELGLVAAACGMLFGASSKGLASLRRPSNEMGSSFSDRTAFVVGASVGLVTLMLHCVVDFDMQIPAVAVTAVTLMALLAAQARFATERYWRNPGRLGKIDVDCAGAAAITYLSAQGEAAQGNGDLLAGPSHDGTDQPEAPHCLRHKSTRSRADGLGGGLQTGRVFVEFESAARP